jgi:hypothetical protein
VTFAYLAPWRETGFLLSKRTEQSENVYENKGSSMLKMRFLLAIVARTTDQRGNLYVAATVNEPAFSGTQCALSPRPAGNTDAFLLEVTFAEH